MERRKLKIKYKSDEIDPIKENVGNSLTLEYILSKKIILVPCVFTNYSHNCMLIFELILSGKYKDEVKKETMLSLKEKFIKCWMTSRNDIKKSLRIILWLILCRIELICYEMHFYDISYGNIDQIKTLIDTGILLLKKRVTGYSILEFWRSLMLLVSKFNNLVYSKQLDLYVSFLMTQCGRFTGVVTNDDTAKDYVALIKETEKKGQYITTESFWKETERVFYYLKLAITEYQAMTISPFTEEFDAMFDSKIFEEWFTKHTKGIYKKYILQKISDKLYDVHVKRGDKERFKETQTFGVPTPYNVISAFRLPELDSLATRINSTLVEDIIKLEKENASKKWHTSEDFVLLCRITMNFIFDAKYENSGLIDYFTMGELTGTKITSDEKFPLIKKVFNEYGVCYKGTVTPFAKLSKVFCYWIWIICNDPDINGKILNTKDHLTDIYEELFPNDKERIEHLYELNNMDGMLTKDIINPSSIF